MYRLKNVWQQINIFPGQLLLRSAWGPIGREGKDCSGYFSFRKCSLIKLQALYKMAWPWLAGSKCLYSVSHLCVPSQGTSKSSSHLKQRGIENTFWAAGIPRCLLAVSSAQAEGIGFNPQLTYLLEGQYNKAVNGHFVRWLKGTERTVGVT